MKKSLSIFVVSMFYISSCFGIDSLQVLKDKPLDRDEIIHVFHKAIKLNEEYKNINQQKSPIKFREKLTKLEKYNEEVLSVQLRKCVKLLSKENDYKLAKEFFRLLISYENSADEFLSYAMGNIFYYNPNVIIKTFKKFSRPYKKYLYKDLEFGWKNFIYEKDHQDPIILDRTKKIKILKDSIDK